MTTGSRKASQIQEISRALNTLQEVSEDDEIREIYELRRKTDDGIISEMTVKTIEAEKKGRNEGRIEGRKEEKIEIAKRMILAGLSVEQVSQITQLSIEEISKVQKEIL